MAQMPKNRATPKRLKTDVSRAKSQVGTLDSQRKLFTAQAMLIRAEIEQVTSELNALRQSIEEWVGVFSDTMIDCTPWVVPTDVATSVSHVGKVRIATLEDVSFPDELPDPFSTPLWVDAGIQAVRKERELQIRLSILQRNFDAVEAERKRVTRLYNYLDKVRIPRLVEQIRVTQIALDDAQREESCLAKVASDLLKQKGEAA